jgi:hypothetical protein
VTVKPSPRGGPPHRPPLPILAVTVIGWAAMLARPESAVEIGAVWGATCALLGVLGRPTL